MGPAVPGLLSIARVCPAVPDLCLACRPWPVPGLLPWPVPGLLPPEAVPALLPPEARAWPAAPCVSQSTVEVHMQTQLKHGTCKHVIAVMQARNYGRPLEYFGYNMV